MLWPWVSLGEGVGVSAYLQLPLKFPCCVMLILQHTIGA